MSYNRKSNQSVTQTTKNDYILANAGGSALKLHENYSFPCVEGIVDGTHIPILRSNINEEAYVNRKDFHFR